MASALLGDTTLDPVVDASVQMVSDNPEKQHECSSGTPYSTNSPGLLGSLHRSRMSLPSLFEKSTDSSDEIPKPLRIDKRLPTALGSKADRSPVSEQRGGTSQRRDTSGMSRSLPASDTLLDPFKLHPVNDLKVTSPVALGLADASLANQEPCGQDTASVEAFPNADKINQKVHAMLAATNALKPSPPLITAPGSKFARVVPSKVMAKVSNAWDRFQTRPSLQDGRVRSKTVASLEFEHDDRSSPISTIEIRLNEGDNLNKKKVQQIVGGHLTRKPVADDGKALRSASFIDDPFTKSVGIRTPPTVESESNTRRGEYGDGESIVTLMSYSPFDSEQGFDNDIEEGILCATPVGSSTPRIHVHRSRRASPDPIANLDWAKEGYVTIFPNRDELTTYRARFEFTHARALEITTISINDKKSISIPRQSAYSRSKSMREPNRKALQWTKKHPSPSKEVLEDLETAFRKYADLKVAATLHDEPNELAESCISFAASLALRDANQIIPNGHSTSKNIQLTNPTPLKWPQSTPSSSVVGLSQGPCLGDKGLRLYPKPRLAPRYRPNLAQADDIDELQ